MAKKKFKTRASRDLNNHYTHVRPEDLKIFQGTIEEFLNEITHRRPGYMKKDNGRTIIHWWWESKDKWFMNHGDQRISKEEKFSFEGDNGWFTEADMPTVIALYIREEYKMYFKTKM